MTARIECLVRLCAAYTVYEAAVLEAQQPVTVTVGHYGLSASTQSPRLHGKVT